MIKSGISRKEIEKWGGPEVFNQALALVNSGDVHDVRYDDETVTICGKIERPDGWEMPVSLKLKEQGRIESHCPCFDNQKLGKVCPHVVALGIAQMVLEMDDVEEAPPKTRPAASSVRSAAGDPQPQPTGAAAEDFIEVPAIPKFYALVSGSRAALSIAIDAYYGDIDFPACSLQAPRTVWLPDPDDPLVRRVRSMPAEREAMKLAEKWGFAPGYRDGDLKLYLSDPQKVLNFLGGGLPDLRRKGWTIDLSERLMDVTEKMPTVVPVVTIKDAPNGAFDVRYSFDAVGAGINIEVSPVEIQAALNRHDGYIMKDGAVVLLDNTAIETMHGVFRDCATSQNGAPAGWFRVKGVHAPYVKASLEAIDAEVEDDAARKWRETAAVRNREGNAKFEPVALGHLDTVLRPYQKQGVYWMRFLENAGLCGLLADEMGLGKTLQTLTWLSLPRAEGGEKRPALIVCPTSLVRNWEAESKKFTPERKVLVISGPDRANYFQYMDKADLVITSYALLQRDFEDAYCAREFSAVVLDEAQHIKNRQTKNAKAVKLIRAQRKLALTGTPVENSVADVWSIFDFLMPDYLGDYETFKADFEDPIASRGDDDESPALALDALDRLKRKIQPFIMRRVKKSVAKDLPDKIVKVSRCPMSEDFQREYNAALAKTRSAARDAVRDRGFAKARFEILAMLMKLRQIASRAKLDSCLEVLVSAIEGGHKILVFSQFVKMLSILREELAKRGIRHCYLDGSTKDRLGECRKFNQDATIPVFLISLKAGGTGLNLTGADMVVHFDPWWNPAVEDQATDRAHRIGQKRTVCSIKLIAKDTVEEKVLEMQRKKQSVIKATVGTDDSAIMQSLTWDDIKGLLS